MTETGKLEALAEAIKTACPGAVLNTRLVLGELTVMVDRARIAEVARFLRDDPAWRFKILIDICGADYPEHAERFEVVYHFLACSRICASASSYRRTPPRSFLAS